MKSGFDDYVSIADDVVAAIRRHVKGSMFEKLGVHVDKQVGHDIINISFNHSVRVPVPKCPEHAKPFAIDDAMKKILSVFAPRIFKVLRLKNALLSRDVGLRNVEISRLHNKISDLQGTIRSLYLDINNYENLMVTLKNSLRGKVVLTADDLDHLKWVLFAKPVIREGGIAYEFDSEDME